MNEYLRNKIIFITNFIKEDLKNGAYKKIYREYKSDIKQNEL